MSGDAKAQLHLREQKQWLRLRALRVERAREALRAARLHEQDCQRQVQERRDSIARTRTQIDTLATAVVDQWATQMNRWAETVARHREVLLDVLERAEYALIDDERALEAAREAVSRLEGDLSRALVRESAATTVVGDMRRARAREDETAVEREIEDRPLHSAGATG